jgi:hypothetical protein
MAPGSLYVCVVSLFLFAMGTVPLAAERDLDLTAADGTTLKASYFPRPRRVPESCSSINAIASASALLITQRDHGINLRRAARGQVAGKKRNHHDHQRNRR